MINIIKIKIQNLKILEELELSFEKYHYEHSNTFFSENQRKFSKDFHLHGPCPHETAQMQKVLREGYDRIPWQQRGWAPNLDQGWGAV